MIMKHLVFLESMEVEKVAHVKDDNSIETAMIPFCEFGGNMSVMGVKIDQFEVPFCNSFRPKLVMDQLCYQVDPNEYKDKIDLKAELSLTLFIHFNEDRQMEDTDTLEEPLITIDTIGITIFKYKLKQVGALWSQARAEIELWGNCSIRSF